MTFSRRLRAGFVHAALVAFSAFSAVALSAPAAAQSAQPSGQTFSTPGYTPPRAAPQPSGSAGATGPYGDPDRQAPPQFGAGTERPAPRNGLPSRGDERGDAQQPSYAPQRAYEPPKPNEFQKFVEIATGRLLPIFGAEFFSAGPAADFRADAVPVSADYTVGPGDEVVIRAWGSIDIDYRTTVDRNGQLNLPKIGSFGVAGVKAADLERSLRAQIGRLYTNFQLSVSLGQLRALRVFVVGPAQRPGVYTLPSQSTLLSALTAAGGPAPQGSMRRIELRRDGRTIAELDFYDFLVAGDKSKDLQLAAGDVIVLQPAGPRVALSGATDAPAVYELKAAQESLRDLLRYAGGAPVLANTQRAQLERIDPSQPKAARFVESFALDAAGQAKQLRDGDVLTLLAISPRFANAVTLKGHVAQPLRYPFQPGMRIRDLIPDRDALITPDFYKRKNLLVQVLEEEDEPARPPRGRDPNLEDPYYAPNGTALPPAGQGTAGTGASPSNAPRALPGGMQRRAAEANGRPAEDETLRTERRRPPAPLFDELNWDYAVIERLDERDLSTRVIPFNLGKAVLQGDETNNLELKAGDVVTVYSQKDIRVPVSRQTRLVSVEGEVASPGVYQLEPGETLQSLVRRAGGFTPQAYVYGLDFSREETRRRQRENLQQAITRLQALSSVQSARDAANRRDEAGAQSQLAVSNAATQAQLARLSRLEPNGRIALELSPAMRTLDALPDVPLEHADRIVVPPRPGFVTVAGAVVNSNAFLWKPGRTAGDYLRLAGADEAADPSNMFILRADGTVSHAGDRRGLFGRSSLEAQEMQPGDALIVPNQLDFETFGRALVRNLKDWSQIFSQFGLGIAAINSLNN